MNYFIFILILISNYSIACECIGKNEITPLDYNETNIIFIGTFVKEKFVQKHFHGRIGYYVVRRAYKGVKVNDTVEVEDAFSSAACGLQELLINKDYLVYGYLTRGCKVVTSDCNRTTRVLNLKFPEDSILIKKLSNLKSFGRIYDSLHTNFYSDTVFLNSFVGQTHKIGIKKFFSKKGELLAKGAYLKGLPIGMWEYYNKGVLVAKGKYTNGKRDSVWYEKNFFDNDKNSYDLLYYKYGQETLQEINFFRGIKSEEYYPIQKGKKWIQKKYHNNGKLDFYSITDPPYINDEGLLQEGIWNGPFKQYDEKGYLKEDGQLYKGFETGLWKYYKNGKIIKTEIKESKANIDKKKED